MITRQLAEAALKSCIILAACAGMAGCAAPRFDLGPLASHDAAPDGAGRVRALGPVFEKQSAADGNAFLAVRPFYAGVKDPAGERSRHEFFWPVGMNKHFAEDWFWRLLTAYGNDFDTADPESRYRFVVFPIVFSGRDKGGEGYFALFPLGGTIHEYLGRDRIAFVLFPLFGKSSVDGTRTTSILWPFISKTEGEDVSRFRVFPFYGRSVNEDRWTKQFVCWPVWTSVRYDYPDSKGDGGFILFPLFGRLRYKDQRTLMFLPPFFRWTEGEREKRVFCPWPFFQYSRGEIDKLYIWPLWGRKESPGIRGSFLLWPIVNRQTVEQGDEITRRLFIVPFLESEISYSSPSSSETNSARISRGSRAVPDDGSVSVSATFQSAADGEGIENEDQALGLGKTDTVGLTARYFKLWPLFSWQREARDSRFRMLELWPTRDLAPIERNFTPFWTLYSRVRVGDVSEQELLWGLFRRRTEGSARRATSLFPLIDVRRDEAGEDSGSLSILKGLLEYKRVGLRKTLRLLYFIKVEP